MTRVHDSQNRLIAVVDALGNRTTTGYNAANLVTSVTNPLNNTWTTLYDSLLRPIAAIDPLGNRTSQGYDNAGNRVSVTNPIGAVFSTNYDSNGRPVASVDPLGNTASMGYDGNQSRRRVGRIHLGLHGRACLTSMGVASPISIPYPTPRASDSTRPAAG